MRVRPGGAGAHSRRIGPVLDDHQIADVVPGRARYQRGPPGEGGGVPRHRISRPRFRRGGRAARAQRLGTVAPPGDREESDGACGSSTTARPRGVAARRGEVLDSSVSSTERCAGSRPLRASKISRCTSRAAPLADYDAAAAGAVVLRKPPSSLNGHRGVIRRPRGRYTTGASLPSSSATAPCRGRLRSTASTAAPGNDAASTTSATPTAARCCASRDRTATCRSGPRS